MFELYAFLEKTDALRHSHPKTFLSNAYLTRPQYEALAAHQDCAAYSVPGAELLCVKEEGFHRIYYYASDLDALEQLEPLLPEGVLVAEQVSRHPDNLPETERLARMGLLPYKRLIRVRTNSLLKKAPLLNFKLAPPPGQFLSVKDTFYPLLRESFDSYISHLPTLEALAQMEQMGLLFTLWDEDCLAGGVCVEDLGANAKYIYQIVVSKDYQGQGIGQQLLSLAASHFPDSTVYTAWVETENIPSLTMFQHSGFQPDGLFTQVFLRK